MPERPNQKPAQTIVTLRSLALPPAGGLESAGPAQRALQTDEERLLMARYAQVLERLRQETTKSGTELMVTVSDRDVSLLQSEIARQAQAARTLQSGGLEAQFGTGITGGDILGWIKVLFTHVDRANAHPILRPTTTTAAAIADHARIALTADWGTGLYGAPLIADQIRKRAPFDLLLHLGDIYYSGTPEEVQERFLAPWPKDAGAISRTLNSNHEMYSGGQGYFEVALPAFDQSSSYFAFQNQDWLLVGLDTAYVDHDMDTEQVAWLNVVIDRAREAHGGIPKKLVLFSHQQPFSRLDSQGPKLQQALRHLLESRAITAWYWGHEHQCVIFDPHPVFGLLGRCLGNGGIPEPRKGSVKAAPAERTIGNVTWKRLTATADSPSCLVLDGPNPAIKGEENKFVPHGFMTLEFNGPALVERVLLADGTEILSHTIE
jgi:hypothetical protein